MDGASTALALISVFLATVVLDRILKHRRFRAALPPSHNALPLLGNLLDIPTRHPWKTYEKWARELNSEIISIWTFGHLTLVINSGKAARELLGRRSANYGDRPCITILDLAGALRTQTALMPYGERWRAHRRILHRNFNLSAATAYLPVQEAQIKSLLQDIYKEPGQIKHHLEHFTTALTLLLAYGYHDSEGGGRLGEMVVQYGEMMTHSMFPGALAVNALPALKHLPGWLPGLSYHTFARKSRQLLQKIRQEPYDKVKTSPSLGVASPSVIRNALEQVGTPSPSDEEIIQETATSVHLTGAEGLLASIHTIILALLLHPEVQKRAQKELDGVTGRTRLPTYDDKDKLPYLEAVRREVSRWMPVVPLGVQRSTINDDVYEGMFIPAGTTLMWNSSAMTHDPEVYPEPDVFRPDRYLDEYGRLCLEEDRSVFGFGRRECIGMHIARSTNFLVMASILSLFDLRRAQDKDGNDIEINVDFTDGIVSHPKDFQCCICPRDDQAVKLLKMMMSSTDLQPEPEPEPESS